jgi:transposase
MTEGQRHEQAVLSILMERGAVKHPGQARSRIRPDMVAGDERYSSSTVRPYLKERRIGAVTPPEADEVSNPTFDPSPYQACNVVESLINSPKQWRRIATRYEKRAANYHAMVTIGMILLWL